MTARRILVHRSQSGVSAVVGTLGSTKSVTAEKRRNDPKTRGWVDECAECVSSEETLVEGAVDQERWLQTMSSEDEES